MSERPVSEEIRSDYVGSYKAYLYADGHVETDPPGRPQSKEDLQRARLRAFARANAGNFANKSTALVNPDGTPAPQVVARSVTVNRSMLLHAYSETQQALADASSTARTPDAEVKALVGTLGIGGPLRGS